MTIANNIENTATTMTVLKPKKSVDWRELFFKNLFLLSAAIGILSLVTIGYFIFREGFAAFAHSGVTGCCLISIDVWCCFNWGAYCPTYCSIYR